MAEAQTEEKRTGGCRCGGVRYELRGKPLWVAHCHCSDCRRSTGAPFLTWSGWRPEAVSWTTIAPAPYRSSQGVTRSFCPACGTPIAFTGERWPNEIHVLVGTLDDPGSVEPRAHTYWSEKLSFIHIADKLKKFAKTPKEGGPLPE
jgi:hypothetical protein